MWKALRAFGAGGRGGGAMEATDAAGSSALSWQAPEEGVPHRRTWMAFGATKKVWGAKLLPQVRQDLASVAANIALFEPVSLLVRPDERQLAQQLCTAAAAATGADPGRIELVEAPLDDIWMRDSGPVFVQSTTGEFGAACLNFNAWGGKQACKKDTRVAGFVAERAGAMRLTTRLVMEGGGLEVDGCGTAILTESCILNRNRNPSMSKAQVEEELLRLFGVSKAIWLPGLAGQDITDGHIDFYARFARPGVVFAHLDADPDSPDYAVTRKHLEILKTATDASGRPLEVHVLTGPDYGKIRGKGDDFCAGYVGYFLCNGGVVASHFGDEAADAAALTTLRTVFPDREVLQLAVDGIAAGGGTIHCVTQQEPGSG